MEDNEKDGGSSGHESAVIIDLGKKARKKVKKLRKGRGPLLQKVDDAITELKEKGEVSKSAAPVIVVVREKKRNRLSRLYNKVL